jgi:hypothetical protein
LSIKEDDVLLAFDQEDDWLLVQSEKDGKAGFVPANYVEVSSPLHLPTAMFPLIRYHHCSRASPRRP